MCNHSSRFVEIEEALLHCMHILKAYLHIIYVLSSFS